MKRFFTTLIIIISVFLHSENKTALCLSGGGARGFAHIGLLKAIDERNIRIDAVYGTSMGAYIGALYSLGYTGLEIEQIVLSQDWQQISEDKKNRTGFSITEKIWYPESFYSFEIDENNKPHLPKSLLKGHDLMIEISKTFFDFSEINDFQKFPIPFTAIATNLRNGQKQVFTNGNLAEVVRASMSIPSILEPFNIGNETFVDGGILENIPINTARLDSANFIIASNVTSPFKDLKKIKNIFQIYDQVLNISLSKQDESHKKSAHFNFKPKLNYSSSDFKNIKEIIDLSYFEAQTAIDSLKLPVKLNKSHPQRIAKTFKLEKIEIVGNQSISDNHIRLLGNINESFKINKNQIFEICQNIYSSNLFDFVYPILERKNDKYFLYINVKERHNKWLNLKLHYNLNKNISIGSEVELRNIIQKNSILKTSITAGGIRSFNIDYLKNIGKNYGIFYHIQPNINEQNQIIYGENHRKFSSIKSLTTGITSGIGFYANKYFILEGFHTYRYQKFYQDIAISSFDDEFMINGIGGKIYAESIDETDFPMEGKILFGKIIFADNLTNESEYQKLNSKLEIYSPIIHNISLIQKYNIATCFTKPDVENLKFRIGGYDSLIGYYEDEFLTSSFLSTSYSSRFCYKNFFVDYEFAFAFLHDDKFHFRGATSIWGHGFKFGYRTQFTPIKAGIGINKDNKVAIYFEIGYQFLKNSFSDQ